MQVKKPLIHEMAEQERPREKFELYGADKMSDAELLALILRTGCQSLSAVALAEEILSLNLPGSGLEKLHHLSKKDLMEIHGVGRVKAIEILALCELSVRLSKLTSREQLSFNSPASIARYYTAEFRSYRQEHLMMMLFDSKNHLVGERLISKGTINASMAEPRDIFGEALRAGAFSIILIHNHPSGNPTPSVEDELITKKIKEMAECLEIEFIDQLIVGKHCFYSFASKKIYQNKED